MSSDAPEPEVYESPDVPGGGGAGLVSLPAQQEEPSSSSSSSSSSSFSVGDIVNHTVDAREAFEVFMGRRYDPSASGLDVDSLLSLSSQDVLFPSHPGFETLAAHLTAKLEEGMGGARASAAGSGRRGGAAGGHVPKKLETPLARYTRLVEEVHALQSELRAVEEADKRRAAGTTTVDNSGGVFRLLTTGTSALDTALGSMQGAASSAPSAAGIGGGGEVDAVAAADRAAALDALRGDIAAMKQTQMALAAAAESMRVNLVTMEQRLTRAAGGSGGGKV